MSETTPGLKVVDSSGNIREVSIETMIQIEGGEVSFKVDDRVSARVDELSVTLTGTVLRVTSAINDDGTLGENYLMLEFDDKSFGAGSLPASLCKKIS